MKKNKTLLLLLPAMVMLLSCSTEETIPHLYISPQGDIPWDGRVPATLTYVHGSDSLDLACEVKFRGGSSSKFWKHSYRVELDEHFPMAGLPSDDDWILNANYIDKTFMRHKLNYDLFRQMDPIRNRAPLCTYVEVTEGKRYEGLYVLMEKMNAKMLGLTKKDSMSMLFKDPPVFLESSLGRLDSVDLYEQKWPKFKKRNISREMDRLRDFLFSSTDDVFENEVKNWVDLENVIDWHLLLLFTNNGDGIVKNFYVYKKDAYTPFRIAIWDYDMSYGRDADGELNMLERMLDCDRNIMLKRLMGTNAGGYHQRLADRWTELRTEGVLELDNVEALISENEAVISKAVLRNEDRWPTDDLKWHYDPVDFRMELDTMRKAMGLRFGELDVYFDSLGVAD